MARMRILTRDGVEDVELKSARARSVVGAHWNAIQIFLSTGDTEPLEGWGGIRIRGRRLLTDPDEIERQARIGELDIDDIYEDPQ
jgi:hypothetical protein